MPQADSPRPKSTLKKRLADLESELADLQVLYETTIEHGTALENELMAQNQRMESLQGKMRKYLSPQLYQALVGGTTEANTKSHNRTKLTIYFSDIVGFSDLTDSIEPELLSDVLNSYLTRMAEIALEHGGTIDKFIGDAMMVFFGAPEFDNDISHARRCVQMALKMREALYQLRETWKLKGITSPLQVRAGINTGICTVGNFGSENRMDYTIIGGQVNLASRLQSAARPDSIYLSSATYLLVKDSINARYVGPTQVKGIHTPVEVWELLNLQKETTTVSPYLSLQNNRLQFNTPIINLTTLTDAERTDLEQSLTQAMVAVHTFTANKPEDSL